MWLRYCWENETEWRKSRFSGRTIYLMVFLYSKDQHCNFQYCETGLYNSGQFNDSHFIFSWTLRFLEIQFMDVKGCAAPALKLTKLGIKQHSHLQKSKKLNTVSVNLFTIAHVSLDREVHHHMMCSVSSQPESWSLTWKKSLVAIFSFLPSENYFLLNPRL